MSGCYSDGSQIKLFYSNKQFLKIQESYLGAGKNTKQLPFNVLGKVLCQSSQHNLLDGGS